MITSSGTGENHELLLYYLIQSNRVKSFLLHLLHRLSQKQEHSFTFLMHACKWKWITAVELSAGLSR